MEFNLKDKVGEFKDSKLFETIKSVAPTALDTIGDIAASVYPPIGGPINAAIDLALDVAVKNKDNEGVKAINSAVNEYLSDRDAYLKDVQDAREMYENSDHDMADKIAERVINYNLWVVMAAVIIEILAVIFIDDKVLIAIISGAIGSITTALLQERQTVIGFFFGSSKGSKDKDLK